MKYWWILIGLGSLFLAGDLAMYKKAMADPTTPTPTVFTASEGFGFNSRQINRYSIDKQRPPMQQVHNDNDGHDHSETQVTATGWHWTTPENWHPGPSTSSMRLATFSITTQHGNAECSIIQLGGAAGGLVSNVNRWRGQLGLPPASNADIVSSANRETGAMDAFTWFRLVNPETPERGFLISVFELPESTLFVKTIAPVAALDVVQPGFVAFCKSIRRAANHPEG